MKVLLFGDGPELKEKGRTLREQNGWTVHLRSIQRWAGDVEPTGAAYFLEPADAIRAAYKDRGIDCFLVEETGDAENAAGASADMSFETGTTADSEAAGAGKETASAGEASAEKAAEAKARRQAAKKGK